MNMDLNRSKSCPDDIARCETKRQSKPSVKALENKVESLQAERKAKVNKIKCIIKTVKELMQTENNAPCVQSHLDGLSVLLEDAGQLHKTVIQLLPPEEQDKQNAWFSSVRAHSSGFMEDVKKWLSNAGKHTKQSAAQVSTDNPILPQSHPPCVELEPLEAQVNEHSSCAEPLDARTNDDQSSVSKYSENNVGNAAADDVKPSDSISNVASRSSKKRSSAGSRSSVSSTSSARIKAEADVAALMARQKLLKDKHALEEQEEQIRKRKEQLGLQMEIAASIAKVKVLQASEGSRISRAKSDGMNSYFEREQRKALTLNADAETFVPVAGGEPSQYVSADDQLHSHLFDARPKERNLGLQPRVTSFKPKIQQGKTQSTQACNQFQSCLEKPVPTMQNGTDHNRLITVLEKQNEITSLLVEQQSLLLLPKRDIQTFDGDPLQFQTFMMAFEHSIEEKTHSAKDCLYFLEQYTRGQPRELVRSCQHMPHDQGYAKAKSLLRERFGNSLKIASAYMEKVLTWPVLKSEDVKALQAYSLLLRGCCNAMGEVGSVHELDVTANMQSVIKKLPYKLRDMWRNVACDLQDKFSRRVTFRDIVEFIERQVRIASDPLFGDIQDSPAATAARKDVRNSKSPSYSKVKGSSFATTIATVDKRVEPSTKREKVSTVCLFCGAGHTLDFCRLLENKTHSEKMSFLKENGVCFGCLCIGHRSKDCRRRLLCKICNLKHPTMLHIHPKLRETDAKQTKVGPETANADALISVQSSGLTGAGERDCTLSILPVRVKSKKGDETLLTYAFLDPGSTASFCTESLMNRLNLPGRRTSILLRTMGQEKVVGSHIVSDLEVAGLDTDCFCELPDIFTQKSMPVHQSNIPRQEDLRRWPHLEHVQITGIDSGVDLLIGINVPKALEPWEVVRSIEGGPYAVKTLLGWTVNGPLRGDCSSDAACMQQQVTVNRISVARLEELWEQQTKADFPECAQDEQFGLSKEDHHFMESVTKSATLVNGHYSIGLPLRQVDVKMPNNKMVAEQRALNLKRKFNRDSSFHTDYTSFMNDIISKGYAERVPAEDLDRCDGRVWYIPHHGVYHPQKKKMRVVFDCGATFQGTSLNAQLVQGPDLTSSLVGVVTRFRRQPVVLMADIAAMFHQVRVPSYDADLLRFLWWPEGDHGQDLVEYRMVAHLFGATSSPSCASFALRKCADDNQKHFSPKAVNTVLNNFYVDDCLVSVGSEEEAVSLYEELCALCAKGGFQLTKWISNRRTVLAAIPQQERAAEVKDLDLDNGTLPVERALGVQWCVQSDSFKFKIMLRDRPLTRRGILSTVSSIYDPLGLLAPVVLSAKRILQNLCRQQFGWDDVLPVNVAQEWKVWLEELHQLEDFKVNRCLKPLDFGKVASAQLHHFADASEDGYGTVTYLLLHSIHEQVHCAFVMGKARVAPLKSITIPRMELTAAVVASRMDKLWRKELQMPLQESVFWTDSTSVLKYIRNETARFKTFVANRVSEILTLSNSSQWRYVNTSSNPADLASRGARVESFLKADFWVSGPKFLVEPEMKWPISPDVAGKVSAEDPEVKPVISVNAVQANEQVDTIMRFISYFSSWIQLKRMVGWILRFKTLLVDLVRKRKQLKAVLVQSGLDKEQLKGKLHDEMQSVKAKAAQGPLSVEDLDMAETAIISFCQRKRFTDEICSLQKGESVKRNSHLYRLDPILEEGVLRVGGRLSRSAMPDEAKHPAILAKDLHISDLILRHIHQQTGHGGRNHMLSKLRQRFWIPGASTAIRKTLSKCIVCRRLHAAPGHQRMADLPQDRVSPDEPPFTRAGVDCFGPFEVKRGRGTVKRYGVIFTCLAVRAIHLEVASSLDTDSFVNALRRFIARRGQVLELRSDNGTNFVGAERELREAIGRWNHAQINDTLIQKGIKWIFNPPSGSHHGGVWERLIRSVRKVLNSILKTQNLDEECLHTVLCEVEAIINSRPITKASTDPNDLEALTPNHLLLLKSKPSLPPGVFQREDMYVRRRWRQVQYMSDLFWKRWIKEYLPQLQERQKWQSTRRNFVPGDVVVIVDDSAPRNSWLTGRVVKAVSDKGGLVRQIRIKTRSNYLDRPITKVCLLQEAEEP